MYVQCKGKTRMTIVRAFFFVVSSFLSLSFFPPFTLLIGALASSVQVPITFTSVLLAPFSPGSMFISMLLPFLPPQDVSTSYQSLCGRADASDPNCKHRCVESTQHFLFHPRPRQQQQASTQAHPRQFSLSFTVPLSPSVCPLFPPFFSFHLQADQG